MQYHAIPCNTMQYNAIPCNHAIPCIINNCWRSVPLPSGQYMAIFICDRGISNVCVNPVSICNFFALAWRTKVQPLSWIRKILFVMAHVCDSRFLFAIWTSRRIVSTNTDNHDVPSFSSDLLLDNKQTPLIFSSEYIFNLYYMFRRSGPGHMLLHIVHK